MKLNLTPLAKAIMTIAQLNALPTQKKRRIRSQKQIVKNMGLIMLVK